MSIERGEIFGFLGSNGCGKSTTMKMLTGLLPPTEGTATLFGNSVEAGSMEVRNNLGYMTQAFSLYGELTVRQNLVLRRAPLSPAAGQGEGAHRGAGRAIRPRAAPRRAGRASCRWACGSGCRWRSPSCTSRKILILDEPTSGVDPVARDSFWELLIDLSRKQGVTIFVTTHFMNEGMRCDRISLMNAGKVLACDAPQKLIEARGAASLEEAFIGYMEDAMPRPRQRRERSERAASGAARGAGGGERAAPPRSDRRCRCRCGRMLAYARNETIQILRDPVRLAFAFVGSALLMLVFGFGITTDVEHIRYAAFDLDQSPESRAYLEQFAGSPRYFTPTPPVRSADEALERLQSDDVSLVLEIPPNFGRDLRRGCEPRGLGPGRRRDDRSAARPSRSTSQGVHNTLLQRSRQRPADGAPEVHAPTSRTATCTTRRSRASTRSCPSVPALLLILIPAILMTVSIVREKELGSIINFYVTPTGRLEYLLGKQLPYIAIGMINFFILVALALIVFGVPIKGSFLMLTLCTLLYVTATTGIGMVTSTFTSSQVAAVFVTAILTIRPTIQFSGLLQPVSTLEGSARFIGSIWPTTYYMHSSLGAYTKGLGPGLMVQDIVVPGCSHPDPARHQHRSV